MSKCKKCQADVIWRKKPDGTFYPPENPDGSHHDCEKKTQAAQPGGITGKLEEYTQGSASFTVKGGIQKTYAITAPMQRDWASANFLLPASNHPDVWLEFSVDSKNFILPGWKQVQPPAWASELTDPTAGQVSKPAQKSPEPPKETPCTSPQAAPPVKKDEWSDEREEFCDLLTCTDREGMPDLLQYLVEKTDFFIAPSSTKYHDARDGGLLHHSLSVYHNLKLLAPVFSEDYPPDSLIIIGLLHDLCKVNFYKLTKKSLPKKGDKGELILDPYGKKIWEDVMAYDVEDQFPLGHGEKSVILIQRYIRLTDVEIMAIRWHMMAYDDIRCSYAGNLAITNACAKFPIIPLMHIADLSASFLTVRAEQGGA